MTFNLGAIIATITGSLCSALVGVLIASVKKLLEAQQKNAEEIKKVATGVKLLEKCKIEEYHFECKECGKITNTRLDNVEQLGKNYHDLEGNSYIEDMITKTKAFKLINTEFMIGKE